MFQKDKLPSDVTGWLDFYAGQHPKKIDMSLKRIREVAVRLELLENFAPIILVGGTNGKGSTCAMLCSIMSVAGYRVGLFTSPHLLSFHERIRINRTLITDEELLDLFPVLHDRAREISLTYFEASTLIAMMHFKKKKVDVIILEVGLGGRLDSTNIFSPCCSVVVSVDLDHQNILGHTREKIAIEKAGIFRDFVPVVCGDPDPPLTMLQSHPDVLCVGKHFSYKERSDRRTWDYYFYGDDFKRLSLPIPALRGSQQVLNASIALTVLHILRQFFPVDQSAVKRGLLELSWPARFQVLPGRPLIILDVAHNPHAVRSMIHNLEALPFCRKFFAVYSMLEDKDIHEVLTLCRSRIDQWYIAGLEKKTERGLTSRSLFEYMSQVIDPDKIRVFDTIQEAFSSAKLELQLEDALVVFGSFHTVEIVMNAMREPS